MFELLRVRNLSENVREYVFEAKKIVKHAKPGQFVILRVDEEGERVPFTLCDIDKENETITLLVQTIGASTMKMAMLKEGDKVADIVGPLGNATDLDEYQKILLVSGGIGGAVTYPQIKYLSSVGKTVDNIMGARNKDLLIYKENFDKYARRNYVMTDDGSFGEKGFVTNKLEELLNGEKYDVVFAVGPLRMMQAVCNLTKKYGVKTIVSMNSIMVDGTGMCGGCRLTVDGKTKYACVDGPEFDGHLVDFEEAINRSTYYREQEQNHVCRLRGKRND